MLQRAAMVLGAYADPAGQPMIDPEAARIDRHARRLKKKTG
jgi:hypothetical protein